MVSLARGWVLRSRLRQALRRRVCWSHAFWPKMLLLNSERLLCWGLCG